MIVGSVAVTFKFVDTCAFKGATTHVLGVVQSSR
jgi:hypothetical protein